MTDRLDIIVFGATGFTGKLTLPYIYKLANATEGETVTWGIAGRSQQKLKDVLNETAKRVDVPDLDSIPIIIADVEDEESIKKMTAQAKVIVNCCGPYLLYGEVVVKACVEIGTHHVDVTAESKFMEEMQLKYHKAAEDKGIYIVSACGIASIPSDLGVLFLEKHFEGTLNSIETYLHVYEEGGFSASPQFHYGTWTSSIEAIATLKDVIALRKKLYTKPLPELNPKLSVKPICKTKDTKRWALPLLGPLDDVVNRSQQYFYENNKKRPIQYPEIFSNGFFSHKDPSEDVLKHQHASFTFYGEGWSKTLDEDKFNFKALPNKTIVGRVHASNPAYGFSCLSLALCAVIILTQPKQMPVRGAVYTSAVAFSKTSLIEDLQKNGVIFEILSNNED